MNTADKESKEPELRFSEFKDEWELKTFGSFLRERVEFPDKEYPLYSLTIANGIVPKTKRYERSFLVKSEDKAYKVMHCCDFAYNPMNLRFGALAMHKGKERVLVSKYYDIFYCNDNVIATYVEAYFTTHKMIQFYNKMATGSLNEKRRVHYSNFVDFKKLFPPKKEQKKIASFLVAVDEKLTKLQCKQELLTDYKRGMMQQIFSQQIRFKADNGSDFPDWITSEFSSFASRVSDKLDPQSDANSQLCIELDCIEKGSGKLLRTYQSVNQKSIKGKFQKGDILFGKLRPNLRKYYHVNFDGVCSSEIWILRSDQVNHTFLYYLIQTERFSYVCNKTTGSKMPRADWQYVGTSPFDVPPHPDEQQKIANLLTAIDTKFDAVSNQITQMEAFKKGLLQQMFV